MRDSTHNSPSHVQRAPTVPMVSLGCKIYIEAMTSGGVKHEVGEAGPSTSQMARGGKPSARPHIIREGAHLSRNPSKQKEEWVVAPGSKENRVISVRAASPEAHTNGRKRLFGYRPRSVRCVDVPPQLSTKKCKKGAWMVKAAAGLLFD